VVFDAAVVSWEQGTQRPATGRSLQVGGNVRLGATFWGLLFGLIFFVPLLGAAVGAPPGANTGWLVDAGITDHFVNRVRDEVVPGTSALFVVAPGDVTSKVEDAFFERGQSDLLAVDLNSEQEQALQQVFGAGDAQ